MNLIIIFFPSICVHLAVACLCRNGVVGDPLVGWPPIKNFSKLTYGRLNYNVARPNDPVAADVNRGVGDGGDGDGMWRFSYLKVQMEGVLITRKINLSFLHHHQSYNALTHSLISLFGKGNSLHYNVELA
ncbi:hypothetical protein Dimus_013346 [Dionaea muscipula]